MMKSIMIALTPTTGWTYVSLMLLAWTCIHCSSVTAPVAVGVATVETSICVMNTWSKDTGAGLSEGEAIADCVKLCGTDAATITRILDSHRAAEIREMGAKP